MDKLLISVKDAASMLNIGEKKLRQLIMEEKFPVVRFGRSVKVNPVRLAEWLENYENQQ